MDSDGLPLVGPGIDYTKLEALAIRLQRLETSMNILEAKLSSIPGLENVTVSNTATNATPVTNSNPQQQPGVQSSQQPDPSTQEIEAENSKEVEETPRMTVAQDPRYAKYFKMVQVGVPAAALRGKMLAEGLDPDLLDNPSAPAPGGSEQPKQQSDSDSDFSDDEENTKQEDSDSDSSSGFSD